MTFEEIEIPSNRKFGFFFTVVFAFFAGYFAVKNSLVIVLVLSVFSALTLIVTISKPKLLLPLNKLWMRLGFLLGKIINPVVLGVIFFILFTPIGIVMRLAGRDELRLKRKASDSYWKERSPIGPEPSSFKQQF